MTTKKLPLLLSGLLALPACMMSSSTTPNRNDLAERAGVGQYPPPPGGIERPRVGLPAFRISDRAIQGGGLDDIAAEQLFALVAKTRRFDVIERAQLEQLLEEQELEGIVRADELARMGEVRGVRYLLYGRVDNFRTKKEDGTSGISIAGISVGRGQASITVDCGVDLRLVDSETGTVVAADYGEYSRTDSIGGWGVQVGGIGMQNEGSVEIGDDNAGIVLRMALHDALSKMLPDIDRVLREQHAADGGEGRADQLASTSKE